VYGHPHRDKTEKPEVDVGNHWSKIIMQRAEGQHRRDLTFPHANWQWVFKSTINLGASLLDTVRAASQTDADGSSKYDISDFSAAANEIVEGLRGHYLTPGGVRKEVKGDMQHLHSLDPPLSSLAKTFLRSFQATNRNIEGTQEIRTMMRKDGEAFAVMYGGNVFITISPNERQNALMIRCARSLRSDPMRKYDDDFAKWTNIDTPSLEIKHHASLDDERTVNVPIQAILGALPDMQSQQALLAKDPLASVYGFHILVRITLRALFGVRICSDCPDCNTSTARPGCCDELGNVATPEGGILGLIEAYHGSIESQGATGSLHAHMNLFLNRMHQHTKMIDIAKAIQEQGDALVQQFERFTNHVCKATYHDADRFHMMQDEIEQRHKLNRNADEQVLMVHGARGEEDETMCGKDWCVENKRDSDAVRMTVNHHIHPKNEEGERIIPKACKTKTTGDGCRANYPKKLLTRYAVMCDGLLKQQVLPKGGKHDKSGFQHPERNDPWVNGAPDIMLRCTRCNVDLQNLDRLPTMKETHSGLCPDPNCMLLDVISNDEESLKDLEKLVAAAEQSQRTCRGYSTDYVSKRQGITQKALTDFINGHHKLCHELKHGEHSKDILYQAKRTVRRLLSDCVGRGTTRMTVEVTNLAVNRKPHDKTAAESFKSNLTVTLPTSQFINVACGDGPNKNTIARLVLSNDKETLEIANEALLGCIYSQRGTHPNVWSLTPYEFLQWYEVVPATYPTSLRHCNTKDKHAYHCQLTQTGK
jgi:hypothetical protein